jgi:uncharacterized damage-inducible protein DinB
MNLLDRLLGHDLAATRELLLLCGNFTDAQMDQEFDAGWRTLRKTFDHMISNVEVWTDLMLERPVRRNMEGDSVPELLARLDAAYAEFAAFARQIEDAGRLDDLWTDVLDDPPAQKSYGGAIGHVITHNMHHRAEIQHMLYRLDGVNAGTIPEGDLMGWDQRARQAWSEV